MKTLISILLVIAASAVAYGQGREYKKFKDDSDVPRISIEDAKKAYDDKTVLIVDARSVEGYNEEHIRGAISIPLGTDDKFDSLPRGKMIIVYCT